MRAMNVIKSAEMAAVAPIVLSMGLSQSIWIGMLRIAWCWTKQLISKWKALKSQPRCARHEAARRNRLKSSRRRKTAALPALTARR